MLKLLVTLQTLPSLLLDRVERNERGATAVEYGLMVSLIAVVIIAAVTLIGTNLDKLFSLVGSSIKTTTTN